MVSCPVMYIVQYQKGGSLDTIPSLDTIQYIVQYQKGGILGPELKLEKMHAAGSTRWQGATHDGTMVAGEHTRFLLHSSARHSVDG